MDIVAVHTHALFVDDDIEPAPENVPGASNNASQDSTGLVVGQHWNWNGICQYKSTTQKKEAFTFNSRFSHYKSALDLFLFWMPSFVKNTIVSSAYSSLKQAGEAETSSGEFLLFIGLWSWSQWLGFPGMTSSVIKSTMKKSSHPCTGLVSTRREQIELILSHLHFTHDTPLEYREDSGKYVRYLKHGRHSLQ